MLSKKGSLKKMISKESNKKVFKKSLRHYLDFTLLIGKEVRPKDPKGIKEMVLKNALNAIVLNS